MPNNICEGPQPNLSTAPINPIPAALKYKTILPTLTNEQQHVLLSDDNGGLYVCGSDRVLKVVKIVDTAPVITATSDEISVIAANLDYQAANVGTVYTVQELWSNSYSGGMLHVKATSVGAAPAFCRVEIFAAQPTFTTATDYVLLGSRSASFAAIAEIHNFFFDLNVSRFYVKVTPIGAVSAGVNYFTLSATLSNRGLKI